MKITYWMSFFLVAGTVSQALAKADYTHMQMDKKSKTESTKAKEDLGRHFNFSFDIYSNANMNDEGEMDVTGTNAHFLFSNAEDLNQILSQDTEGDFQIKNAQHLLAISAKTSLAPYLLKDKTEEKLLYVLDRKLALKKESYIPVIEQGVNQKILEAKKQYPLLPDFLLNIAKQKAMSDALAQVDAKLALVRKAKANLIKERVDELVQETVAQEVLLTYATNTNSGALVHIKMGKTHFVSGASLNQNDQSQLEQTTVGHNFTQRVTSTSSTTGAEVGYTKKLDPKTAIFVTTILFHNRLPWMSGGNYVSNTVNLNQKTYGEMQDLERIDSASTVLRFKRQNFEAYAQEGTYNGDEAYSAGFTIPLGSGGKLHVDYAAGRKYVADESYSVFYEQDVTQRITVYVGAEKQKNTWIPLASASENGTVSEIIRRALGARARLAHFRTKFVQGSVDASCEVYDVKVEDKDQIIEEFFDNGGARCGVEANANF